MKKKIVWHVEVNTTNKFVLTAYTHLIERKHNEMSLFKFNIIPLEFLFRGFTKESFCVPQC